MNHKIFKILILLCLISLVGCNKISDLRKEQPPIQTNETNTTQEVVVDETGTIIANTTNVFFLKSENLCILVIDENNLTTVIDCGDDDLLLLVKKTKQLGISKIDVFYYTQIKPNHKLLVSKFDPDLILEKEIITFDNMLILGNCVGECEGDIIVEDLDVFVLANGGKEPTNSMSLFIQINPSLVITNIGVGGEVSELINVLEVENIYKDENDIHLTLNSTGYDIR